jgi:hypothetical protein
MYKDASATQGPLQDDSRVLYRGLLLPAPTGFSRIPLHYQA